MTDEFRERMTQDHGDMDIGFSIMVLGANFWPLNAPNGGFNIPVDIVPLRNRFSEYHRRKYSGRKLVGLWNYSKNELRTNYLYHKYILMTSSYQMAILLQYNDQDTLTLYELATATAMDKDVLLVVLAVLVAAKILTNEEKDRYDLNPSNFFLHLYDNATESGVVDFKAKKIRVNLNLPVKAKVASASNTVDEDRKYQIQATICRYASRRCCVNPCCEPLTTRIAS